MKHIRGCRKMLIFLKLDIVDSKILNKTKKLKTNLFKEPMKKQQNNYKKSLLLL